MTGKRIGFVDNDLNNFHANVILAAIRNELAPRGFTVAGCTANEREKGMEWATKNGVPYYEDVRHLNEHVDYFAVLAPSTPQTHLPLCEQVLPYAKTTYVDKPFAPDLRTAEAIFSLSDRHGVAVQTSSALRYTAVQTYVKEKGLQAVRHVVTWGPGRSFDEYAIHPIELAVSCLGPNAERLMRRGSGQESQLIIDFSGGRTAVVNIYLGSDTDYAASITTEKDTKIITVDGERLFIDTTAAILDFFGAGKPLIDRRESLTIMRIIDAARTPQASLSFVAL